MVRRNIQHGQKRRMPWSRRLPLTIIVIEIAVLLGVIIFGLPPALEYFA